MFQTLRGIWLSNLEDNVFYLVQKDLTPFKYLTSLGLSNCNVALREGRTRGRTRTRKAFIETLSSFEQLVKLDLSENSLAGCLGEVLESLARPLEYLKLKRCDIVDADMESLARSKHAKSLKYLNVARVCGLFMLDDFAVTPACLVNCLKDFSALRVLHAQQNQLGDAHAADLCSTIERAWPHVKAINLADNVLARNKCYDVVRSCALAPSVEYVKLPHAAQNMMGLHDHNSDKETFLKSLEAKAKANGKPQLKIEVLSVSFAFIGNP